MVRALGSWSSVRAEACALRELTASGRERGAGVSAAQARARRTRRKLGESAWQASVPARQRAGYARSAAAGAARTAATQTTLAPVP
jgi:hypothetical protein